MLWVSFRQTQVEKITICNFAKLWNVKLTRFMLKRCLHWTTISSTFNSIHCPVLFRTHILCITEKSQTLFLWLNIQRFSKISIQHSLQKKECWILLSNIFFRFKYKRHHNFAFILKGIIFYLLEWTQWAAVITYDLFPSALLT